MNILLERGAYIVSFGWGNAASASPGNQGGCYEVLPQYFKSMSTEKLSLYKL